MDNNMKREQGRFDFVFDLLNLSDRKKITLLYFVAIACLIYTINLFFTKRDADADLIIKVYTEQRSLDKQEIKQLKQENKELYQENKTLIRDKSSKLDSILKSQEILLKNRQK